MLFSTLVLVSIDGEHDCLQQGINLGHGHKPAQVRDMPGLRLQQEHEVAISLSLVVIWEDSLLNVCRVFQVACNFVLLLQGHAILNQQGNPRVEVPHVLLEDEVLLGLGGNLGLEVAEYLLGCGEELVRDMARAFSPGRRG